MKVNADFYGGFVYAVFSLGREGDYREADWSEPYNFLKTELNKFEVETPERDEEAEIKRLRSSIRSLGEAGNVCTFGVLKEVCTDCYCKRSA